MESREEAWVLDALRAKRSPATIHKGGKGHKLNVRQPVQDNIKERAWRSRG